MEKLLLNGSARLVQADCLDYLKTLPDNSIDLVVTDPPYFQVKKNAWDNQWDNQAAFMAWLDEVVFQFWRVLRPAGSLYLFCSSRLGTDTEVLIRERLNVLNHIIWAKPNGPWRRQRKEGLRSYFPSTERVIFAEHYGSEGYAKGCAGYASKCSELKKATFAPLIEYFRSAREALGVSAKDINEATGTQMCSHWFSASQWQLPSEEQYTVLQQLFAAKGEALGREHSELVTEYQGLTEQYQQLLRQYDDLKAEYESLRRPFRVTKDVPHTDVWNYTPVAYYLGKHPCEKPAAMAEDIINASSRPGQVVLDAFMGSGAFGKAAVRLGRSFVGIELEEETFLKTCDEFAALDTNETG